MALIRCSECQHEMSSQASSCPSCGCPNPDYSSPWTAAFLSFVLPGVGQMYKGRSLSGIAWLVGVLLGYLVFGVMGFFAPAVILHLFCVVSAATAGAKQ